jgi:hypothetical protein
MVVFWVWRVTVGLSREYAQKRLGKVVICYPDCHSMYMFVPYCKCPIIPEAVAVC